MKVNIDFSIFVSEKAYANVVGSMEFSEIPQIGDSISLNSKNVSESSAIAVNLIRLLEVENRIFRPMPEEEVDVLLAPLVVPDIGSATTVIDYLERELGLFVVIYE